MRDEEGSEDPSVEVPDDISDIVVVGDVTVPIVREETAELREWGDAMKRIQLLSDEELFSAVDDPHPGARCEALLRLRARCAEDPRTLPLTIDALNDSEWQVRDTAVMELRHLAEMLPGEKAVHAIDAIRTALGDSHEDVRSSARYSLDQLGA